jgi:Fic family protein
MVSTLRLFLLKRFPVESAAGWYLHDIGEHRGRQELYRLQAPQRLKALRESALVESVVSSNRIEGIALSPGRVRDVLAPGQPLFRDRNEEEVRGYRDALALVHKDFGILPVSSGSVCRLHAMTRGQIWDAGKYKEKDGDIIERYPDGSERVRFRTTPEAMECLIRDWHQCLEECWVQPLIALAAFNLDFLCIHPFRDGNGRVSRLLWLLQSYQLGYEVGRYISLERLVEASKDRYYETLEASSQGWHEGLHNPWPYIHYVLSVMKSACSEFRARMGEIRAPRGEKSRNVIEGIEKLLSRPAGMFRLGELEQICPGVSRDMVRHVLREQQAQGVVQCSGRGSGAVWTKPGAGRPEG